MKVTPVIIGFSLMLTCAASAETWSPVTPSAPTEYVGKSRWIKTFVKFYSEPFGAGDPNWKSVDSGKLTVLGAARQKIGGSLVYQITLADGRAGYIDELDLVAHTAGTDPVVAAADCKKRGNPRIGMSKDQVIATCWGKPDSVNRTETATAILDQYVYGSGTYVYLRNGVVESVQNSGTLR